MLIACDKHGPSGCVPVCSHLDRAIREGEAITDYFVLEYNYEGERLELCVFCRACATVTGISKWTVLPLPDEYPSWYPHGGVCLKCFCEAAHENEDIFA